MAMTVAMGHGRCSGQWPALLTPQVMKQSNLASSDDQLQDGEPISQLVRSLSCVLWLAERQ